MSVTGFGNPNCNPATWTSIHDYNHECCSVENPCGEGEGDCDSNGECKGNLVCGSNNCGSKFPTSEADCCTESGGSKLFSAYNFK